MQPKFSRLKIVILGRIKEEAKGFLVFFVVILKVQCIRMKTIKYFWLTINTLYLKEGVATYVPGIMSSFVGLRGLIHKYSNEPVDLSGMVSFGFNLFLSPIYVLGSAWVHEEYMIGCGTMFC